MNKKILIPSLALAAVIGLGSQLTNTAYAQESNSVPQMAQNIATRFNIDVNEVSAFFDEQREARRAERVAEVETKLDAAVSAGTLTAEQKELLVTKMEENRANREDMRDLTPEERRTKAEEHRVEMQAWAENNGIDLSTLDLGRGGPEGGRHGRGEMMGGM